MLRHHLWFGSDPKEFRAFAARPGADLCGRFETYHRATPLSLAAGRGRAEDVRMLLEKGVPVDTEDELGSTPLLWACSGGHADAVKVLLEYGANVHVTEVEGMTPLHFASMAANGLPIVRMLLDAGADTEVEETQTFRRPLDNALQAKRFDIVEELEAAGATRSPRRVYVADHSARRNKLKAELKLKRQLEAEGVSPDKIAASLAEPDEEQLRKMEKEQLARSGAVAKEVKGQKKTPRLQSDDDILRAHCWFGNKTAQFEEFLERPDFDFDSPFDTLHRATPVILAASRGLKKVVDQLVARGVDVNATNTDHCNALSWACTHKHFDTAELLVRMGSKIDVPDRSGLTPLHYAAIRKDQDPSVLEFLLKHGAQINTLSSHSKTALDLAMSVGNTELAAKLRAHGGRSNR